MVIESAKFGHDSVGFLDPISEKFICFDNM